MTTEPQRLQYLDAMGLTAWVGRYRLPNARPTPECEWELPEPAPAAASSARLHELLEQPDAPPSDSQSPSRPAATRQPGRARALLGEPAPTERGTPPAEADEAGSRPVAEPAQSSTTDEPQQALRFALQVAAIDARWLVLVPDQAPPEAAAHRLLLNLLRAAGIEPAASIDYQAFRWPMMDELPVEAPLEEARDGLRAFLAGRQGWRPERVLVFGDSDALAQVLAVEEGRSTLLELPAWWGPPLETLAGDAEAKRALLRQLPVWRAAWRRDDTHDE